MFTSKKRTRSFTIYAIMDQQSVYVGKTQGELKPVYYRHRRAENVYTLHYYYPPNSKEPKVYILEKMFGTFEKIEKHISAWICIFQQEGYQVINPQRDLEQVDDLQDEVRLLTSKLWPSSMETFLRGVEYIWPRREDSANQTSTPPVADTAKRGNREKITLWATPEDKQSFVKYAKKLRLTQSQALQYLMSKVELEKEDSLFPNWDNDIFVRNLREGYECEIATRDEIIHKLQLTLGKYKEKRGKEARKRRQCYEMVKNAVTVFYKFCYSTAPIPMDIERGIHKEYITQLPNRQQYQYPTSSGASLVRMHAVLLGEGNAPARFVLGMDEHGQGIKLRFYPSDYFVGVNPDNARFAKRSSVWYFSWRKNGEVAELIVAFPMEMKPKYRNPMDKIEIINAEIGRLIAESNENN